ncbi:MAG: type IV pilus biogenesis protein PilM [Symbiopectobacterium sp.]|uniref:type IV pilus biogenesis protein PilM n=1 Tax=Symbiopectobacterium sp. TaxID=2952789 RepID=UPI003F401385
MGNKGVLCRAGSKNWSVLRQTPVNYQIDATLKFNGDFKSALRSVLELYQSAKKPLYAETNSAQCLIRITDHLGDNGLFNPFFLLVTLSLAGFYQHQYQHADNLNSTKMTTTTTQQAIETVHYINAINNYLYRHPDVINNPNEIVLTAAKIGITPHSPIQHVIASQRVFVWQPFSPGEMEALKTQTRDSALLGSIKNHRFF